MKIVAALLALTGCGDNLQVFAEPTTIELTFPSAPNRQLDLLFVIDDSPGGPEMQAELASAVGPFFDELRAASGSLPDLHIGVITSDLGTTGSLDPSRPGAPIGQLGNGGCAGAGDDGLLQTFGAAVTDAYLVDEDDAAGGRRRNYQDDLLVTLGAMLRGAGGGGCGFEQPLHALRRGLLHPANQGFVRADAHLGIVILTDEDDCSLRDPALLAADTTELGPLQSFRCTAQGVACDQRVDELGVKTGCEPREDSAYVEGSDATRALLVGLKARPSDLSIVSILGDPTPFVVEQRSPPGGGTPQLALAHSCSATGPNGLQVADPGVRIASLTDTFAARGATSSVCELYTTHRVNDLARLLKQPLGVVCLDSTQLTDSSTERGIQPACELAEIAGGTETRIRACPLADDCFEIVPDATACPETTDHLRLVVHRISTPSAGAYLRARCETPGYP